MIDLHTHILCGVDDGAQSEEDSLQMLQAQWTQGVRTVVFTPHFYRDRQRPEWFLNQRAAAMEKLQTHITGLEKNVQEKLPKILLGAEVAWRPNMYTWDDLDKLCIEGTKNMLLELPFVPWDADISRQLYALMNRTGITPILAHVERYEGIQSKRQMTEILELGLPLQLSSSLFLHRSTVKEALKAVKKRKVHIIASDCHDMALRKPDLGDAMAVIAEKLGPDAVYYLQDHAEMLLE